MAGNTKITGNAEQIDNKKRTSHMESVRVFIVEDDKDFIFLMKKMLEKQPDITVAGSCSRKEEAVQMACVLRPQIVIMDLNLGTSEMDGIHISREIRLLTDAKVLILTSLDSPEIVLKAAKEAFASGYVFKNQPNLLVENILALAKGYTAQEYLIASMALSGLTEAEMGVFQILMGKDIRLQSSPKTIANQKTKILKKLGLESQRDLLHIFKLFRS